MSVSEPGKIITPWAESGLKNTIPPAANPATGRAGFDQGFSAINMTAKEAGGIPPFGQDFNGIFYEVTNILRYMQAGGQPAFDAALATAIGGYPKGAMVLGSDGVTLWQSKVGSNFTDPDSDPASWGTFDIGLKADLAAPGGAGLIGGLAKPVTWSGFAGGADPSGATPSDAAFSAANKASMYIPFGAYKLTSNWVPTDKQAAIKTDAAVVFTGAKPNFTGLIPFQGGPIWSGDLYKKTYKSADWSGFVNIFQSAHYATSEIPSAPKGGGNVVALYSGADAKGVDSSVWAGNLVAYANNAKSTAIGIELNYGALVDGGLGYGLVIASAGFHGAQAGIQLQANNTNAKMSQALRFNNREFGLADDYLVGCSGDETSSPANIGIDFGRHSFPGAEISTKSLLVGATRVNSASRLKISGAAPGESINIGIDSSEQNVNLAITPMGNGQVLINTNGSEGFRVSASGQPDSLFVNQGTGSALLGARGGSNDVSIHLAPKGAGTVRLQSDLSLSGSNRFTCATAVGPWSGGFTQTAFTVTSDERTKTRPFEITDAMLDAVAELDWVMFQIIGRILDKGEDSARWHVGVMAQRVKELFEKHGVDAHAHAFFCYDQWDAKPAVTVDHPAEYDIHGMVVSDAWVEVVEEPVEAGDLYSIRYEELLVLKIKQIERDHKRQLDALVARIEALESN